MLNQLVGYAPVQLIYALAAFLLIAIQSRLLGPEKYGIFALLILILEIVRSGCAQWINTSMLRLYGSENSGDRIILEKISFSMLMFFSPIGILVLSAILYWQGEERVVVFLLMALSLLLKSLFTFYQDLNRLQNNKSKYIRGTLCYVVSVLPLTYFALKSDPDITMVMLASCFAYIFSIFFLFTPISIVNIFDAKLTVIRFLHYGIPLLVAGFIASLNLRVDRFFIEHFLTLELLGIYAAQLNMLSGLLSLVFMIVAMPLYPELASLAKKPDALVKKHAIYLDYLLAISLPAALGLMVLAKPIVVVLLGDNYWLGNSMVFSLLVAALFLLNIKGHYLDHGFQFKLKTNVLPIISIIVVAFNAIACYFLIRWYGLLGAAISTVGAQCVAVALSYFIANRYGYCFRGNLDILKTIVATAAMVFAIVEILNLFDSVLLQLVAGFFVGVAIYTAVQFALRYKDLKRLKLC